MTTPCTATRGRRYLTAAITLLLLVMTTATAAAEPQPGPTNLTATTAVGADFVVTVTGTLVDTVGEAIPDVIVNAQLSGAPTAEVPTNSSGVYSLSFTIPEAQRGEEQQLIVAFAGVGGLEASQVATTVGVASPPVDSRLNAVLTVSTAAPNVSAGGLVIIEGVLVDQNQAPVAAARIRVTVDENESTDSLVMTDDAGAFQTFAEIPAERPAGEALLAVTFAGNDNYKATTQELALVVDRIPVASVASPEADPSEPADEVSASADASASSTPDEATQGGATTDLENNGTLEWFYVALIVVGGAAILTAAGLLFRGMYWRRSKRTARDAGSLDLLMGEGEPVDDGSLFFDEDAPEGSESFPLEGESDGDTTEIPRPRRGLD